MTAQSNMPPRPISAAEESVRRFLPEVGDQERRLRARILHARDTASVRSARVESFDGRRLYAVAGSIASEWAFRRTAHAPELEDIIAVLTRLFLAAGALERLEASDAN